MDQQALLLLAKELVLKACRPGSRKVFGPNDEEGWEDYYEVPADLVLRIKRQLKDFA